MTWDETTAELEVLKILMTFLPEKTLKDSKGKKYENPEYTNGMKPITKRALELKSIRIQMNVTKNYG